MGLELEYHHHFGPAPQKRKGKKKKESSYNETDGFLVLAECMYIFDRLSCKCNLVILALGSLFIFQKKSTIIE